MLNPAERALELAQQSIGLSDPNPRVGCVITAANGEVIGEGHTQETGGPHAEIVALRAAQKAGHALRGATAWVTMEPCSHHGRTPPCCDAMIEAGLQRVVMATTDPNPLVAGSGLARLRSAGVDVDLVEGDWGQRARELNIGFFSRMLRHRPWVRMKVAASLDGRTALDNGASQWITGEAARTDGHAWRRRASAVLTGIGTVLDDDPRLDVRLVPTVMQPLRVVVDSRLEIPLTARLLAPPGAVRLYQAVAGRQPTKEAALKEQGVDVQACPGDNGKVDLAAVLTDLGQLGINELHVEAGHKLNGSLVREGLVDEYLIYLAPKLLGAGREMARFGPLEQLDDGVALRFERIDAVGPDLRILARPPGRGHF